VQLTGNARQRLEWVLGLYYFRELVDDDQPANVGLEFFHGAANFDPLLHIINRNYAAYGQAAYKLSRRLTATVGIRAGNDLADVGREQVGYPTPNVQQPFVRRSADWNSWLPRAGVSFQWTPTLMLYASAAEGSKSGGFNGRAGSIEEFNQYEPETVRNIELGLRSDWFEQRLRVNATLFYSQYRDFQILLNRSVTVNGQPTPFSFVGNMPRASIRGAEMMVQAVPLPGLKLLTALGITDGRYEDILPGAPVSLDSQFVDAPKVTVTAGAEYATRIRADYQLTARIDYVHKSTIQFDYGNSSLVAQRPYGLVNARITLQSRKPQASVYLFCQNLGDAHYAVGGIDDGPSGSLGEVVRQMGPPREWGLGADYRF
jgi:iron complex outermembrane receptor protein